MTARTHDAIAFASIITLANFFPPESLSLMTLVSCFIAADIGSILPDIDQAGNRLWDLLPAGETVGKIFRRVFYEHRTLTHSILGVFLIYKLLHLGLYRIFNPTFIDPKLILISIMVGYISHLAADSFTKDGLPLLFPFKFKFGFPPIKALRITTGKWIENFVIFPSVWIYLITFIYFNQSNLVKIINSIKH